MYAGDYQLAGLGSQFTDDLSRIGSAGRARPDEATARRAADAPLRPLHDRQVFGPNGSPRRQGTASE